MVTMWTMDLFQHGRQAGIQQEAPLAHRMRPRTLEEFVGQEHIIGPGRLLRRAIQADQLSSLIFYGPPGTGKTTLAAVIANSTRSHFITINAVLAGVKEIREAIAEALERRSLYNQRTTLFVDEVHRWNKAQQDALLPHVENGTIILVGATTENPYFEVNKALVSRSRIFQLKPLGNDDLRQIALQAVNDPERGYGGLKVDLHPDALEHLVDVANGDARGVLNALELAVETTPPDGDGAIVIDLAVAEESIQRRAVLYDKEGDVHYDTISAFIKSLRGSDPDAALYWMAKMVYAGEDARFIFRRMAILAGEDVGMADPNAMTVVNSCWQTFERVGMPEGRFPLALAALYLATCPKSNSAFAFFDALTAVEKEREPEVPNHLKDASRDKEGFGHGRGYLYPHAYRDHWVAQQYLPEALQGRVFYQPGDQGYERQMREEVARKREAQLAAMVEASERVGEWQPVVAASGKPAASSGLANSQTRKLAGSAWLQRVISQSGRNLGEVRDRLFELAAVHRHHLVLDLNAGTGLLTWEALRRAPEGGVWALAADDRSGEALRQQAERLPEVERPHILVGRPDELGRILALRDESDLRFDRIIARNPMTTYQLPITDFLTPLRELLLPGGRVCLAQVVPRHGQRLYELVDWTDVPEKLAKKVKAAEEAIYHDPADPLVNWDESDLEAALRESDFAQVQVVVERQVEQRRLTADHLERWFGSEAASPGEGEGRLTYGQRLAAGGVTVAELAQVKQLYERQLMQQQVEWRGLVAFMVAAN
jgi:putative ATPase